MGLGDTIKNTANAATSAYQSETGDLGADTQKALSRIFGGNTYYVDTMINKPIVLAEKILKRSAQSGAITIPVQTWTSSSMSWTTTTIPFFLSNDFTMGLSNEFKPTLDPDGVAGSFKELVNGISAVTGAAQVTMQSESMNAASWKGSTFEGFSVECLFLATRRTINPIEIIKILSKACLDRKSVV